MPLPRSFGSDGNATPPSSSPPVATIPPTADIEPDQEPRYQPAHHLFGYDTGDGLRNTLPPEVVPGWTRPAAELTFEMRQLTTAERCRAYRIAASHSKSGEAEEHLVQARFVAYAVRKVGDTVDPGDEFMDRWLADIGFQGWQFMWTLFMTLHLTNGYQDAKFTASRRSDVAKRQTSYTLPAAAVPRRRWAVRTGIDARWLHEVDSNTKVDTSRWMIAGAPAGVAEAEALSRDLSFTFQELDHASHALVSDLLEDPDDGVASRQMETMLSLVSIGGKPLGNSPQDLAVKRRWMEDIGPRNNRMVAGAWAKLHEVDTARLKTFLDSSVALD